MLGSGVYFYLPFDPNISRSALFPLDVLIDIRRKLINLRLDFFAPDYALPDQNFNQRVQKNAVLGDHFLDLILKFIVFFKIVRVVHFVLLS